MNCNNCGRPIIGAVTVCSCGAKIWQPRPEQKLVQQKMADPRVASAELGKIAPHKETRSVFKPGESYKDYQDAMHKSGMSQAAFEAKRLAENGWTPELERKFRDAAHICRLGTLPGAMPEDIEAVFEAAAERLAIQSE